MAAKAVAVTWVDAWGSTDFSDLKDVEKEHKPRVVKSIGYQMKRNRKGITIAGCLDDSEVLDRVLFIPRGMIQKVEELK